MSVACLAVGSRVTHDGGAWTVIELEGDCVTVEEQDSGRTRSVRISQLLSTPGSCLLDPPAQRPVGAVGPLLANLTELELSAVNERAGQVREVLTGYRSGTAEEALAGEPRACYRPGAGLTERYRAMSCPGFDGDFETRILVLEEGSPVHATSEEVSPGVD